mgnify:CR=1 FL=1
MPRDRTGNRRFIPVPVDAELAEVHILDNEEESRAYIDQLWAEAMTIYNSGNYKLAFSPAMQETLQVHQQDFMQEDAQAGMLYAFLEDHTGDRVCSKQLYAEALGNDNIPAEWETRAICEIMNTGISRGDIQGWQAHKTAKCYPKYGVQKGWERVTSPETGAEKFFRNNRCRSPATGLSLLMDSGYTVSYRFGYAAVTAQKPHDCCVFPLSVTM